MMLALLVGVVMLAGAAMGQGNFTKTMYMVPMRDGVQLQTFVYLASPRTQNMDVVLMRTPYNTTAYDPTGAAYVSLNFTFIIQSQRGTYGSKGQFDIWFNSSTDTADTVAWVLRQPWATGVVFLSGGSAMGNAVYFAEIGDFDPRVVRAQFVEIATSNLHSTFFQGGAYRYSLVHVGAQFIGHPFMENQVKSNEAFGPYWENVTLTDKFSRVTSPAVHVAAWYDVFGQQSLDAYEGYQRHASVGKGENALIVIPGGHCAGGAVDWPNATLGLEIGFYLSILMFQTVGSNPDLAATAHVKLQNFNRVTWYIMGPGLPGTYGNFYVGGTDLPAYHNVTVYLTADGGLIQTPPPQESSVSFVYNPSNPVPTLGGCNLVIHPCGPQDQNPVLTRPDVMTFTMDPLVNVTLVNGRVTAVIYMSTNCTDTDITVKVMDVFPNGTSLLIVDGITRARWRNGGPKPSLLTPGAVYELTVDLWSTSYIFNRGHRPRVAISSSNYPRFDANPNNGLPITQKGTILQAHNTIFTGGARASRLIVPVVDTNLTELVLNADKVAAMLPVRHVPPHHLHF